LAVEAALSEDRIVFVDFTAAWCVSCQANKQLVLGTERVSELFGMAGVRSFRADWTRQDPEITRELQRYGRRGVPMYLVLRQGREPLVLPEVLTYGLVRDAVASLER
jgi:thiol:disulfide interchange protein DsbD